MKLYDIIIIGAGPAGLTAAIYGARAGKSVLILEKETIGGNIIQTPLVENIPGFYGSGMEFIDKLSDQVMKQGVDIECDTVTTFQRINENRIIVNGESNTYEGKTCIIATGTKHRMLGLNHENELIGKGVHFCATCDGPFYANKTVAVIGGGNSAVTEAIELSHIAAKVILLQDLPHLTAEQALIDKMEKLSDIILPYCCTKVKEYNINDNGNIESIRIETTDIDQGTEIVGDIAVDGVFIAIGFIPQNDNFKSSVRLDARGYIQEAIFDNIFACGDCTNEPVKQVAVACGDGAKAAIKAIKYLNK